MRPPTIQSPHTMGLRSGAGGLIAWAVGVVGVLMGGVLMEAGEDTEGGSLWLFSLSHSLPSLFFLPALQALWVLTCLLRWSDRMNRLLHTGHANRFSPVWVRR